MRNTAPAGADCDFFGGFLGALLLLWTPGAVFDRVLPWLLLDGDGGARVRSSPRPALAGALRAGVGAILTVQFVLGIYGGYFGGAVGLMMMAVWSLLDAADVKALNPTRTLMVTAANTVAVLCFIVAGAVYWRETLVLGLGAAAGGYGGARLGRILPPGVVRATTLAVAAGMTLAFFVRAYLWR